MEGFCGLAWVMSPSPARSGPMWPFDQAQILSSTLETGDGDSFALPTTGLGAGTEMFLQRKPGVSIQKGNRCAP